MYRNERDKYMNAKDLHILHVIYMGELGQGKWSIDTIIKGFWTRQIMNVKNCFNTSFYFFYWMTNIWHLTVNQFGVNFIVGFETTLCSMLYIWEAFWSIKLNLSWPAQNMFIKLTPVENFWILVVLIYESWNWNLNKTVKISFKEFQTGILQPTSES